MRSFVFCGQHYPLINRRNLDQHIGQKNSKTWQSPTLTGASRDFTVHLKGIVILQRSLGCCHYVGLDLQIDPSA